MTAGLIAKLAQIAASIVAVLLLAWFARWLGLGGEARIRDEDHARQLAFEGIYGFQAGDAVIDLGGYSALVRDVAGRHVLIWLLGNQFVTRMIPAGVEARLDQRLLTIDPQVPGVGAITLNLGDAAPIWAAGLRHIPA